MSATDEICVLRLGSSLDFTGDLPAGTRASAVAQAILAEAAGRPVRTIVKPVWPGTELPPLIERWIAEFEPDVVLICVSSFWVETETLAARIQGFGPAGRKVAERTRKASLQRAFAERGIYHVGRRVLLKVLGGRPSYTPERIESLMESWLRTICRHEEIGVAVVGTPFSPDTLANAKARKRATARRDELRARLAILCQRLAVHCDLPAHGSDAFSSELRLADKVHFNELAHARMGEIDGRAMVAVWRGMNGEQ